MKRYDIDMVNGPLAGKIVRFALPLIMTSIIHHLYTAADVVVVGKFVGDEAQAAVTSVGPLVTLMIGLFMGLGVGVNVVVARALGANDATRIRAVVHTAVTAGVLAGVLLMIAGELAAPMLLEMMGSPEGIIDLSVLYLRVYLLGVPGTLVCNFGSALLRARGDTRRPMYFQSLSGAVNVVLNVVFVVVFHWDVAGVAAATVLSGCVSTGLVLYCLAQEDDAMHLDLTGLQIDWDVFRDIARIGLPAGVQGCLFSLANVVIQSSVNSMGEVVMAGSGAAASIGAFIHGTCNAFYQAAMTFTSQNFGAGRLDRVRSTHRWTLLFGMLVPGVLGVLTVLFARPLLSMYSNDPAAIEQGMMRMYVVHSTYFLSGYMEINSGTVRGLGYSMLPMLVSLFGSCGVRVAWALLVFPQFNTPLSLFLSLPISWLLTGTVHLCCSLFLRPRAFARREARLAQANG